MHNLYQQFRSLLPDPPLQVGTVIATNGGVATVQMPGGGLLKARGTALVGQKVAIVSPRAQTTRTRLMGIAFAEIASGISPRRSACAWTNAAAHRTARP